MSADYTDEHLAAITRELQVQTEMLAKTQAATARTAEILTIFFVLWLIGTAGAVISFYMLSMK